MQRSKEGLLLENILSGMKGRYLLCWNGETEAGRAPFDCACCMTWNDEELRRTCGCVCHERIETMARSRHIRLWLVAMQAVSDLEQDDLHKLLPHFPTSFEDDLAFKTRIFEQHKIHAARPCSCSTCDYVKEHTVVTETPTTQAESEEGPAKEADSTHTPSL